MRPTHTTIDHALISQTEDTYRYRFTKRSLRFVKPKGLTKSIDTSQTYDKQPLIFSLRMKTFGFLMQVQFDQPSVSRRGYSGFVAQFA